MKFHVILINNRTRNTEKFHSSLPCESTLRTNAWFSTITSQIVIKFIANTNHCHPY